MIREHCKMIGEQYAVGLAAAGIVVEFPAIAGEQAGIVVAQGKIVLEHCRVLTAAGLAEAPGRARIPGWPVRESARKFLERVLKCGAAFVRIRK